jgi:hypothetical protein
MKRNNLSILTAGSALVFALLACNFGKTRTSDPFEPVPPTVAQGMTESAPATEAATEVPASGGGACANPYLPVVSGATWNYKMTGSVSDTFSRSIVSVDGNSFTDQDAFGTGVTRQGKWNCEDGSLTALNPESGGSASVSTENVKVDFQTTAFSGVTLPAQVNPGDAWEQSTTLEGTETVNEMVIPAKNEFTNSCKAVGMESVSVEAGTFDAMRVDCVTDMKITVTVQDQAVDTTIKLNGSSWYAANIGMVKSVSTGQGIDSTIELTSYNIP